MQTSKFTNRFTQFVVLHTNRALKAIRNIFSSYQYERNRIDVFFGHWRRPRTVQLVKQLTYHSVEAPRTPSIIARVAVKYLKHRNIWHNKIKLSTHLMRPIPRSDWSATWLRDWHLYSCKDVLKYSEQRNGLFACEHQMRS